MVGAFSDFAQNMDWQGLVRLLMQVFAILLCLTVHETCHGLAAYALGDPTAKAQHRLSLNPLRHIDPFGALMMMVAGFGWAKPVPVNPGYFKHPKSGMAVTALAGPLSNFVLAYLALLGASCVLPFLNHNPSSVLLLGLWDFLITLAILSIGLGVFNLIPFPPLDGSKVAASILPDKWYMLVLRYERWGMVVLMALLWFGIFDGPLIAARTWVFNLLLQGAEFPARIISGLL